MSGSGFPGPRGAAAPWPRPSPTAFREHARWPLFAAVVIAIFAAGLAIGCWFRPQLHNSVQAAQPAATFTQQQISDAKSRACGAFETVRAGAALQTNPAGGDPLAATANARLSLAVGNAYLLSHLDPATPPPLATAVRVLADNLLDLAAHALAGVSNDEPAQAARLRNADAADAHVAELCK